MTWVSSPSLLTRVNVMYAGYIIERGYVRDIFKSTRHPYTLGLLGSLPRLDEAPRHQTCLDPRPAARPGGSAQRLPFIARCTLPPSSFVESMPPLENVGTATT